MGPLPSSTCGFQDLPDRDSSQQKGSDVEEHDRKGLYGPGLRATCVATKSQFEKLEVRCVVCVCVPMCTCPCGQEKWKFVSTFYFELEA